LCSFQTSHQKQYFIGDLISPESPSIKVHTDRFCVQWFQLLTNTLKFRIAFLKSHQIGINDLSKIESNRDEWNEYLHFINSKALPQRYVQSCRKRHFLHVRSFVVQSHWRYEIFFDPDFSSRFRYCIWLSFRTRKSTSYNED
jgi:hypothetical protein